MDCSTHIAWIQLPLLAMYKTIEIVMRNKMTITTAPSTVKEKKYDDNSTKSLNTTFVEHSNHNTFLHIYMYVISYQTRTFTITIVCLPKPVIQENPIAKQDSKINDTIKLNLI